MVLKLQMLMNSHKNSKRYIYLYFAFRYKQIISNFHTILVLPHRMTLRNIFKIKYLEIFSSCSLKLLLFFLQFHTGLILKFLACQFFYYIFRYLQLTCVDKLKKF